MSYEPTTWKDGDLVTSAKLNKIEQGIAAGGGSGVPIIHGISSNGQPPVLDKTWQEIYDAGCGIIVVENEGKLAEIITEIYYDNNHNIYRIVSTNPTREYTVAYIIDDPNSYPSIDISDPGISDPGGTIAV